jgi:hypothetical protein
MCDHNLVPIPEEVGKRNGEQCTKCDKIFDYVPPAKKKK